MLGISTGMRVQLLLAASVHYKEIRGVALLDLYSDTSLQDLNGLARIWTLNTLLGEELLLSDLNQLTQSPEHDLGRNTSLVFRLESNCTGSNSI